MDALQEDESPFEVCGDCGTPVVKLAAHRCREKGTRTQPNREERTKRAEADKRGLEEDVLIVPKRSKSGSNYSYHEMEDGFPACGGSGGTPAEDYRRVTRKKAKNRGRCPCRRCTDKREE